MARIATLRTVTIGTSAAEILSTTEGRVSLLFSPPSAAGASYTIGTDSNVVLGAGLHVAEGGAPLEIRAEVHGNITQKRLYAIASASVTVGVLETVEV
ncbi:MAG: hypothetical protein ACQEXJ_24885 [Myxococcota bacterium]